jgi:hypothetical protein
VARRLLAWIGAFVALICGVLSLWTAGATAFHFYPFMRVILFPEPEIGSAGLGAVSADFAEGVGWETLGVLPSIIINRLLVARVRREGGRLASFHRAHSALLLALGGLVVVFFLAGFAGSTASVVAFLILLVLIMVAVGAQFLALGGVLGVLASQRSSASLPP